MDKALTRRLDAAFVTLDGLDHAQALIRSGLLLPRVLRFLAPVNAAVIARAGS